VIATVRRARSEEDFQALRALFEAYEADLPAALRHGAVPSVEELTGTFAGRSAAFLASLANDDAGCVGVRARDAHTAQVRHLFVAPPCRGLGAARLLTVTAIEFARNQGFARMVLDTNKEQLHAAYRLYRSLGFAECAAFATVSYQCPTFMELRLG